MMMMMMMTTLKNKMMIMLIMMKKKIPGRRGAMTDTTFKGKTENILL
jgi:hypothetical protein